MIRVKEDQVRTLVAAVYDMSLPVGLGFLHYTPEPLTDAELDHLIDFEREAVVALDYCKGRQCKFGIYKSKLDGSLLMSDHWYDHSDADYVTLLESVGIEVPGHLQESP